MTFSLAYVIALVLVIVPCTRLNIVNKSILLNTSLLLHSKARELSDVDLDSHKRIWMRSLGGAAMANDALITQSSTMKRLFCPNNPPFFALISINLELQGGPVPPRPPHQIRLCLPTPV